MPYNIQKLIKNSPNPKLIEEVFEFAKKAYQGRERLSGENYIEHALRVALILDHMGLDQTTIAAGILHDVANTSVETVKKLMLEEIRKKFGSEVARLVERSSQLSKIYYSFVVDNKEKTTFTKEKIENLRRMFFAISEDIRVILIKLASRVDGLNRLNYLPPASQKLYALENMQIFVPIANRLGLREMKIQLEDLSFAYLLPERFEWLKENIKGKYEERERYLKKFIPYIKRIFKQEHIKFSDINSRAKSYWSTYKKLTKRDMDFERIHDLVALRIIVPDIQTCYKALGIIHKYYKPISEEINDYIAKPKQNGYKSLHTTVYLEKDRISEIQIRTDEMHKEAEYGICAHWSYKEQIDLKKEGEKFRWTNAIPEALKTFNIDFFPNQVFTFTPKGDVIVMPKGSNAIDFAYAVHSDIGNHCESAKVGGKIIPLSQVLKNGDVVEIMTNKKRLPSQDWLKIVKTNFAKGHIRKATLEKTGGSLFAIPTYIKKKFYELSEKVKRIREDKTQAKKAGPKQLHLAGQKGMLVNIAKCCMPKTDDQAKAYLTKYRAAVLHKTSCVNLQKLAKKFPEKIIEATWE